MFLSDPWSAVSFAGYAAALLTFVAFFMKDSIRLRQVALLSNVFYALWSAGVHLYPTLALHVALFPVNLVRLVQLVRERRLIDEAIAANELSAEWLMDFMERRTFSAGEALFNRGDPADAMYFVADGKLRLVELGIDVEPGALLGEIGIFSPAGMRTQSVEAVEKSLVYVLRRDDALALYRRDPAFGIYLVRLITRRLVEDIDLERGARRVTPDDAADATRATAPP
ncbi:MAG TPA: cyclic nucleotide-binding domain-containing protein [Candidatus Elarobacter sp.]